MEKQKNVIVVLAPYDINLPVRVSRHTGGLWEVKQGKKTVMLTDRLCMKYVLYHITSDNHYIMGIICRAKDVNPQLKDDECGDYGCLYFNGEEYVEKTTGLTVRHSDWCDLTTNDQDNIIAIWKKQVHKE